MGDVEEALAASQGIQALSSQLHDEFDDDADDDLHDGYEDDDEDDDEKLIFAKPQGRHELFAGNDTGGEHRGGRASSKTTNHSSSNYRKGKWTAEEENYTNKIISMFNRGRLQIPPGTTLRSYLSDKLNCDPMRITKKFAGATSIGKVVYQPSEATDRQLDQEESDELRRLELLFLERLHGKQAGDKRVGTSASSSAKLSSSSPSGESGKLTRRQHERSLRSTAAETQSPARDGAHVTRSMKRIVSAPNFSLLSSLQTRATRQYYDDDEVHEVSPGRVGFARRSAPAQGSLPPLPPSKRYFEDAELVASSSSNSLRSKKRSQSVMDFGEYEHYMKNDQAAGPRPPLPSSSSSFTVMSVHIVDLLLTFSENLRKFHHIPESRRPGAGPGDDLPLPVHGSPPHIMELAQPAAIRNPISSSGSHSMPSSGAQSRTSPEHDVGLYLEDDDSAWPTSRAVLDSVAGSFADLVVRNEEKVMGQEATGPPVLKRSKSSDFDFIPFDHLSDERRPPHQLTH